MLTVVCLVVWNQLLWDKLLDTCFPALIELLGSNGVLFFKVSLLLKIFELSVLFASANWIVGSVIFFNTAGVHLAGTVMTAVLIHALVVWQVYIFFDFYHSFLDHPWSQFALSNFRIYCGIETSEHLYKYLSWMSSQNRFFLRTDNAWVLWLLELTIRYFTQRFNDMLSDIFLGDIAIIVDKDF